MVVLVELLVESCPVPFEDGSVTSLEHNALCRSPSAVVSIRRKIFIVIVIFICSLVGDILGKLPIQTSDDPYGEVPAGIAAAAIVVAEWAALQGSGH